MSKKLHSTWPSGAMKTYQVRPSDQKTTPSTCTQLISLPKELGDVSTNKSLLHLSIFRFLTLENGVSTMFQTIANQLIANVSSNWFYMVVQCLLKPLQMSSFSTPLQMMLSWSSLKPLPHGNHPVPLDLTLEQTLNILLKVTWCNSSKGWWKELHSENHQTLVMLSKEVTTNIWVSMPLNGTRKTARETMIRRTGTGARKTGVTKMAGVRRPPTSLESLTGTKRLPISLIGARKLPTRLTGVRKTTPTGTRRRWTSWSDWEIIIIWKQ